MAGFARSWRPKPPGQRSAIPASRRYSPALSRRTLVACSIRRKDHPTRPSRNDLFPFIGNHIRCSRYAQVRKRRGCGVTSPQPVCKTRFQMRRCEPNPGVIPQTGTIVTCDAKDHCPTLVAECLSGSYQHRPASPPLERFHLHLEGDPSDLRHTAEQTVTKLVRGSINQVTSD